MLYNIILSPSYVNGQHWGIDCIYSSFHLQLLSDWDSLVSQVDDLKQITEAAKRERVLAIDEKDQLLRE